MVIFIAGWGVEEIVGGYENFSGHFGGGTKIFPAVLGGYEKFLTVPYKKSKFSQSMAV